MYVRRKKYMSVYCLHAYCISGTFGGDFNLAIWRFFLNCQTKVTADTIFKRTLWESIK